MARLYVIMSGLLVFVLPEDKEREGMALIVRTDGAVASDGEKIPRHRPVVRFRPRDVKIGHKPCWVWDGERAIWLLEAEDIRFLPDGHEPCPGITVKNSEYLADLKKALGDPKKAKIRSGCIGCDPQSDCLVRGLPALAGRARLAGGVVRPVDIINEKTVSCKIREELWGFRSLAHPDTKNTFLGELFNGLMFEMEVADPDTFRLEIGGVKIPLFPDSDEDFVLKDCYDCAEEGEVRLVVWIENLPAAGGHEYHVDDDLDRHFELLYDLLEYNVNDRLIPYLKLQKTSDEIDPPGSRCIPGAVVA